MNVVDGAWVTLLTLAATALDAVAPSVAVASTRKARCPFSNRDVSSVIANGAVVSVPTTTPSTLKRTSDAVRPAGVAVQVVVPWSDEPLAMLWLTVNGGGVAAGVTDPNSAATSS